MTVNRSMVSFMEPFVFFWLNVSLAAVKTEILPTGITGPLPTFHVRHEGRVHDAFLSVNPLQHLDGIG